MPRIYVLSGPDLGRTYDVKSGDTFGRSPECVITLHDASVSRVHARLENSDTGWRVLDEGSRNGVRVKGERVDVGLLSDGSEFQLGEVLLRFREHVEAVAEPARAAPPVARAPAEPEPAGPKIEFRPMGPSSAAQPPENEEIELEGEWSAPIAAPVRPTADDDAHAPAPAARTRSAAVDERARRMAAAGVSARPAQAVDARGVLQFHRVEQKEGLLREEFDQQPGWLRALLVLVLVVAAAGVAWLVYSGTQAVKGRVAGEPAVDASGE